MGERTNTPRLIFPIVQYITGKVKGTTRLQTSLSGSYPQEQSETH